MEELKEIIQQGLGCLELSEMTEHPDYNLETYVNKVVCPGPANQAPLSPARCHQGLAPVHGAGRAGHQTHKQQEKKKCPSDTANIDV